MVYGKGIYERGKHVAKIGDKHTKEYLVWHSMIARCYNPNYHGAKNYSNVEVCDEWLNFQNFAEWFDDNYYTIDNDLVLLEKDFKSYAYGLDKNYSPNNCIFIPQCFNKIIVFQHEVTRDLPVGVKISTNNIYPYTIETLKEYNDKYLLFKTKEEAYEAYLERVYSHIDIKLSEYGNKIPNGVIKVIEDFIKNDSLREIHKLQKVIV